MGTRADFYISENNQLTWLGSVGWDGYDVDENFDKSITLDENEYKEILEKYSNDSLYELSHRIIDPDHQITKAHEDSIKYLANSKTKEEFIENLKNYFRFRNDITLPEMGWPWPWDTSETTDFAYIFEDGKIYVHGNSNNFGDEDEDDVNILERKFFNLPDMSDIKNVSFGKNSGLTILGFSE